MQNIFVMGTFASAIGLAASVPCNADTTHPNSTASAFRRTIEAYSQDASHSRVALLQKYFTSNATFYMHTGFVTFKQFARAFRGPTDTWTVSNFNVSTNGDTTVATYVKHDTSGPIFLRNTWAHTDTFTWQRGRWLIAAVHSNPQMPDAVRIDPGIINEYPGNYRNKDGSATCRVVRLSSKLTVQCTNDRHPLTLLPLDNVNFSLPFDPDDANNTAQFLFVRGKNGKVNELIQSTFERGEIFYRQP